MKIQEWQFWLGVVQMCFNVALAVYLWDQRKRTAAAARVERVEKRAEQLEKDMIKVAEAIKHLPQCQNHKDFDNKLDRVQATVNLLTGRMEGVGKSLDLIQRHLLDKG